MTKSEILAIFALITFKPGWSFRFGEEADRMWFQICVDASSPDCIDSITGEPAPWRGAKHFLSPHMCRNEIVGAAFQAINRAIEHETREWFRYRGRSIFNPHLDPDALAELASKAANFNTRVNAMTMEES